LTPAAGYIRSLATTAAGFQFASKRMVGTSMAGADFGVAFSSSNDIEGFIDQRGGRALSLSVFSANGKGFRPSGAQQ
jgi:hypothetical protein